MRPALPLLLLALLALPACSDSPTDPDTTLRFTGTVRKGTRVEHPLPLDHGGNMTLTLEDLSFPLLDTTNVSPALISLVVGLGRPDAAGACEVTTTLVMREGTVGSFGLRAGGYCLAVLDSGFLPEDSIAAYSLRAEFTD